MLVGSVWRTMLIGFGGYCLFLTPSSAPELPTCACLQMELLGCA